MTERCLRLASFSRFVSSYLYCPRGDLDEVVSPFLCHLEGSRRGHHTQLGSLFIDHPDLWDPDHLVDAQVSTDGLFPFVIPDPGDRRGHTTTRRPAEAGG